MSIHSLYAIAYVLTGRETFRDIYLAPYKAMEAQRQARPSPYLNSIAGARLPAHPPVSEGEE